MTDTAGTPDTPEELETFEQISDDAQLTEESLQQKLNAYHKAYEAQLSASMAAQPDEVTQHTVDFFKKEVPNAAAQIVWLAHNAESEAVRTQNLKYIIEKGLSDAKRDGDPIKDLLSQLTKPTKEEMASDND